MIGLLRAILLLAATLLGAAVSAQPNPGQDAAQAAFMQRARGERIAIQAALVWTGDYAGMIDGEFGRGTFNAIVTFQKRAKLEASGILDRAGEQKLLAESEAARTKLGFKLWNEPRSGVALGAPFALASKTTPTPRGARLAGPERQVEVEAVHIPAGETTLEDLFVKLSAPDPNRSVGYSVRREAFFVIAGSDHAKRRFFIRYKADPDGLRGFTLSWDMKLSPGFDRVAVAMSNSFDSADARTALLDPRRIFTTGIAAGPQGAQPVQGPQGSQPAQGSQPSQPRTTAETRGLGFVVSAEGHVLTAVTVVEGCKAVSSPERGPLRLVSQDGATGLVLLQAVASGLVPLRFAETGAAAGTDAVLFGLASDTSTGLDIATGVIGEGASGSGARLRVLAPVLPRGAGGPLVDRRGSVIGVMTGRVDPKRVLASAGFVPQAPDLVVAGEAALGFLRSSGVTPLLGSGGETAFVAAVAREAARGVLPLVCEA